MFSCNIYNTGTAGCIPILWFLLSSYLTIISSCMVAIKVAKVVRDRMIVNGKFTEAQLNQRNVPMKFGSGYPSDPICKDWINNNGMIDPIFTFPSIVRFSWAPIKKLLQSKTPTELNGDTASAKVIPMVFAADMNNEEEDNDIEKHKITVGIKRQQEQMNIFLGKSKATKSESELMKPRLPYFERRKLHPMLKI
jgi:ribonuclease H2 subunit A